MSGIARKFSPLLNLSVYVPGLPLKLPLEAQGLLKIILLSESESEPEHLMEKSCGRKKGDIYSFTKPNPPILTVMKHIKER